MVDVLFRSLSIFHPCSLFLFLLHGQQVFLGEDFFDFGGRVVIIVCSFGFSVFFNGFLVVASIIALLSFASPSAVSASATEMMTHKNKKIVRMSIVPWVILSTPCIRLNLSVFTYIGFLRIFSRANSSHAS